MFNLLKVEFYKLKKFQLGYTAILFMAVVGYIYGDNRIGNRVFKMPDNTADAFYHVVSDNSFVFIIAVVTALFIGKDFSSRTICSEIKLGYSRFHILLSRTVMVCMSAVLLHVIYIIFAIVGFSAVRGFDTSLFGIENALWLFTVLLQLAAVICGVVLISFLAKKASEAVVLSALYAVICCNILRNFISPTACFYFVEDNTPENIGSAIVSAFITIIIFLAIAAASFNKAEVK